MLNFSNDQYTKSIRIDFPMSKSAKKRLLKKKKRKSDENISNKEAIKNGMIV